MNRFILPAALLLLVGCGPSIEVGTGDNIFKSIKDGSSVTISCGMLGEKYILGAVRTKSLQPANADVVIEIHASKGNALICQQSIDAVQLEHVDGWDEFTGIRCFVEDPAALNNTSVVMTGKILDTSNEYGVASASFKLVAPEGNCGG